MPTTRAIPDASSPSDAVSTSKRAKASKSKKVPNLESDSSLTRDDQDHLPPPYSCCAWADADVAISAEKERLRRFLSHCLSLDYDLRKDCPDKLSDPNKLSHSSFRVLLSLLKVKVGLID
jgi:hypothetical protein